VLVAWLLAAALQAAESPLLEDLSGRTFLWFWENVNPDNGLVPDRGPPASACSIAAQGFAFTALSVGIERGYITREQGAGRVLTALRFLRDLPQGSGTAGVAGHHGYFYHFLNLDTGLRDGTTELSSVDTAWLMMGVLFCESYFDRDTETESRIRSLAEELYARVEWDWMVQRAPVLCMGWKPESGFLTYDWTGYNEGLGLYVLALGSDTHPISETAWTRLCATYDWRGYQGQEHVNFGPLFGHQFSQAWVDFRGIRDACMRGRGLDYFENSRRATLAQQAYALANPDGWTGYGERLWGLSACDGPGDFTRQLGGRVRQFHSYNARGAAGNYLVDDGTLAPCASLASLPFAPELVLPTLETLWTTFGGALLDGQGFFDAFNATMTDALAPVTQGRVIPGVGWVDTQHLGIDQGPILLMLENYRSGLVWSVLRRNAHIRKGLRRAGFTGGWLEAAESGLPAARLVNLSSRGLVGSGSGQLIAGCSVEGQGAQSVVVRAVGPTLSLFGLPAASLVADPALSVMPPEGAALAANEDWGRSAGATALATAFASVGAFALPADSLDAALLLDAPGGRTFTALASAKAGGSGLGLVEVYAMHDLPTPRLVNLSTRALIGQGASGLFLGFYLGEGGARRLLIRGVGPGLASVAPGLQPLLARPELIVRRSSDNAEVQRNAGWETDGQSLALAAAADQVGAFALQAGSRDAALILEVPASVPGGGDRGYTIQVTGSDGGTGIAIAEIYELPAN